MPRIALAVFTLLLALPLAAQLPNTQVYVFDFAIRDTVATFSKPMYLTAFNSRGYNNQPGWIDRNSLLLSVQLPGMDQPDIYSMDLARKTRTRLTATQAGEYSPQVIAGGNKFSAVRQEYLGRDTVLRLWEFPMDLSSNGKPTFKYINGTGYYEWFNSIQVALFLVQNPNALVLASTDSDETRPLATNTGRCFKRQASTGNLVYVDKSTMPWRLMEQNMYRMSEPARVLTETLPGSEDFALVTDGSILMASGSRIYRYDPIRNPRWVELVDLRLYGIRNITRLSVNDYGRLALVADGNRL